MDVNVMVLLVATMGGQPGALPQHMTAGKDAGTGSSMILHEHHALLCTISMSLAALS